MKKRLLAMLLALTMLFALVGCTQEEAPPETTQPGAEQFKEMYEEAAKKLESSAAVTLDVELTELLHVEDKEFETDKKQVVSYSGLGTDAALIRMEEDVKYSEEEDAEEEV